jgi:dipeptidyl aminopeptidase/acylaminoacyl peptidase
MLRRVLLAMLLVSTPVLFAKERILLYRIGPSQSTLFIANADGSDERPLLPNSGFDYNASFSADGEWIIFTSERGGSADIYRVHPDGSGLERLTDDPAYDDQGALSPDGKQLVFVSSRGTGSADIWVLDLQTKKVRNLTRAPGNCRPSWSPDGKWIAFSSDRNTPVRRDGERFEQSHAVSIYLMRTDGADVRRITSAGKFAGSPKWSPDGERIERAAQRGFLGRELASRSSMQPCDFSREVASGCRACLMKHVIHYWDDERARSVLSNCRRAVPEDGALLLVEWALSEGNAPSAGKFTDVLMLLMTGGKERTVEEYRHLLGQAGFSLNRVISTVSGLNIIEALPA